MIVIYNKSDLNTKNVHFNDISIQHIKHSPIPFEEATIVIFNDGDRSRILKQRW